MTQSRRRISRGLRGSAVALLGAAIIATTLLPPTPALAAGKPIVAVFDITVQGRARLKKQLLRSLADYLATQLTAGGVYGVVPRDQLASRLRKQKKSSYKKCFDQSCQIAIGKEMAAGKSLATKIMKIGKLCVLSATLYDLRTSASERAATAKGKCSEESLLKSIDTVAAKISGDSAPLLGGDKQSSVKLDAIASVAGIRVSWPPRCPANKPMACFRMARKMKEQDQGLVLALYGYVRAKKTANWRVANKARRFAKKLMQGYVPRQTQLEAMLRGACKRRRPACYALATLRGVENNHAKELSFLRRACDGNVLAACTDLGNLYKQGKGTTKSESKAIALYRRACDRSYWPACSQLAYAYRYGRGVAKNERRAVGLYRRACDRRYWAACQRLGFFYSYGSTKNYSKALGIYRRACDGGYPQSCTSLAYMYKKGRGVAPNPAKARAIYMKACNDGYVYGCTAAGNYTKAAQLRQQKCDAGDLYACNSLAYMYKKGQGVPLNAAKASAIYRRSCNMGNISACISIRDDAKVAALYRRGCDGGNMYSCKALGDKYRYGRGVRLNKYSAVTYYRKACNGGYTYACNDLAYMYKYGYGVPRNTAMAKQIYQAACKKGNATACKNARSASSLIDGYRRKCTGGSMYDCYLLAGKYRFGTGVRLNKQWAVTYYRKACTGGYMKGCYELGYLYKYGYGVPRNSSSASFYYRKACAGGYRLACKYARQSGRSHYQASTPYPARPIAVSRVYCSTGVSCYNSASRYRYGRGVVKSQYKALAYYRKGCNYNYREACYQAGYMYKYGAIGVAKNLSQASFYYNKACRAGHSLACKHRPGASVSRTNYRGGGTLLSRYRSGCIARRYMDCYNMAKSYHFGRNGAVKNLFTALSYYRSACTKGHTESCYQAGFMYKKGHGTSPNHAQAVYFYTKACRAGHKTACKYHPNKNKGRYRKPYRGSSNGNYGAPPSE
jgi:TPR repeat protein